MLTLPSAIGTCHHVTWSQLIQHITNHSAGTNVPCALRVYIAGEWTRKLSQFPDRRTKNVSSLVSPSEKRVKKSRSEGGGGGDGTGATDDQEDGSSVQRRRFFMSNTRANLWQTQAAKISNTFWNTLVFQQQQQQQYTFIPPSFTLAQWCASCGPRPSSLTPSVPTEHQPHTSSTGNESWSSPYNLPWRHRRGAEVQLHSFFNLGARWDGCLTPRPSHFTPPPSRK